MLELSLKTDASQLINMLNYAIGSFQTPTQNELGNGAREAASVYMGFMEQRFFQQSLGGGEWAELAELTKKERAKLGFNPSRPILIRTHTLYNAMFPGRPGNIMESLADRIRTGIGGGDMHPGYEPYGGEAGTQTIGEIASILHNGRPNMPPRPILVEPNAEQLAAMQEAEARGVMQMWANAATDTNWRAVG